MKIILISGKAESGKDSTAEILRKYISSLNLKSIRLAYGDYVKTTARDIWGWDEKKDECGRALLQWWGTDCVRKKDPNFWVDTVIRLAKVMPEDINFIVIPDTRFPNEITRWKDLNLGFDTMSVRVERPGHVSSLTTKQLMHISETALDNWKFDVVLSASDISSLTQEIRNKLAPILI